MPLETRDILDVEIFATGTWNGQKFGEKDLDELIDTFYETRGLLKPSLKLGHTPKQKLVQSDGLPSIGWLENLRKKGGKLIGDFKRVPKKIQEIISAGGYRKVSIEIFIDYMLGGKKYPKLLSAVALLGGDIPAVKTLDDIIALYSLEGSKIVSYSEDNGIEFTYSVGNQIKEDSKMADEMVREMKEEMKAQKVEFAEKQKSFEDEIKKVEGEKAEVVKENEALKGDVAKKDEVIKKVEEEKKLSDIDAKVEKYITDKKIVPADKEMVKKLVAKSFGDKEAEETLHAFIEKQEVKLNTEDKSQMGKKKKGQPNVEYDDTELAEKAQKYMEEHKGISLSDATIAVSKESSR